MLFGAREVLRAGRHWVPSGVPARRAEPEMRHRRERWRPSPHGHRGPGM